MAARFPINAVDHEKTNGGESNESIIIMTIDDESPAVAVQARARRAINDNVIASARGYRYHTAQHAFCGAVFRGRCRSGRPLSETKPFGCFAFRSRIAFAFVAVDDDVPILLPMRACCFRIFVDGELWDCLLVLKRSRRSYALYTTVDRLPSAVSVRLRGAFRTDGAPDPEPARVDANCLERVIKTLECSDAFRRSVVRNAVAAVDDNNNVAVWDVSLVTPDRYRLPYVWCELYEKTNTEYRELENIMAWLSTLGGAFSSLGDQTEHCAIVAGKISVQQLKIAMRIGDPLTAARCKLYASISLMQRGLYKQAKFILKSQYKFIKSQSVVDERLIKMCCGIWTKLRYERNRKRNSQSYYPVKNKQMILDTQN